MMQALVLDPGNAIANDYHPKLPSGSAAIIRPSPVHP